ncbi:hypothetical protein MASR2M50_37740 [Thauera sp.]
MKAAEAGPAPQVFRPPGSSVLALDFQQLKSKLQTYLKPEDVGRVEAAYHFSADAHAGQFRVSGEPYVSHPVAVCSLVADWHLDPQALIAALLHDVMEDTHITKAEIAERFGKVSAELVDGLSKLDKIEFRSQEEAQAENFRKMLLAMASDLRVILIKLADRLHNMRTLDHMRPAKRRRIANETLEIYAPIANRLGLNDLFRELQELSFRNKYPLRFEVLAKAIRSARGNRREVVGKILASIEERLPQWGIAAEVQGREKHLYGIYRKMVEKHLSFSQVLDIYGFRVIVRDVPSCYLALGALHSMYKPVPGKFKDYLAIPKANGYQSLHTTLIGPFGMPVEVQIRTREMHHIAETGVASHWLYKEDEKTLTELQQKTHSWLQSLLELQSASGEATEFLEHVKIDLFPGEVYVFSPKGKIFSMPKGSTPVDFAYAVHTDVGNRCVACRINGDLMPLRSELRNGDQVEIITAAHANPNPAWLSYARTGKARAQIRHFMKNAQQDESVTLGERLLNQALRPHGLTLGQISSPSRGTASCATAACATRRRSSPTSASASACRSSSRAASPRRRTSSPAVRTWSSPSPRGRSASAARRAWRCSSRAAAIRFRATRSSAPCARARASRCTPTTAPTWPSCAATAGAGWTSSGSTWSTTACSTSASACSATTRAACWRGWRARSPRKTATSRASAWMAGRANTPRSTSPCRCATACIWRA